MFSPSKMAKRERRQKAVEAFVEDEDMAGIVMFGFDNDGDAHLLLYVRDELPEDSAVAQDEGGKESVTGILHLVVQTIKRSLSFMTGGVSDERAEKAPWHDEDPGS